MSDKDLEGDSDWSPQCEFSHEYGPAKKREVSDDEGPTSAFHLTPLGDYIMYSKMLCCDGGLASMLEEVTKDLYETNGMALPQDVSVEMSACAGVWKKDARDGLLKLAVEELANHWQQYKDQLPSMDIDLLRTAIQHRLKKLFKRLHSDEPEPWAPDGL